MAITNLNCMKENIYGLRSAHLRNGIEYILKPEKTEGGWLVGGNSGYSADMVYNTFMKTKEKYNKKWGRQGYHFIIALPEEDKDKITNAELLQLTEEFVSKLLSDEYDVVTAVHTDTEYPHAHIIFNSVNRKTGYKYRYERGDWAKTIQPITNDLCKKYGISELKIEGDKKEKYNETYEDDNKRQDNDAYEKIDWKAVLKKDIDSAINIAKTYEEFLQIMQKKGYKVKTGKTTISPSGFYISFKQRDMKYSIRSYRLGDKYDVFTIQNRIKNKNRHESTQKTKDYKKINYRIYKMTVCMGKKREYIKWDNMSIYQKQQLKRIITARRLYGNGNMPDWEKERYVRDITNMTKEYSLMVSCHINSYDDAIKYKNRLVKINEQLDKQRNAIYKKFRKYRFRNGKEKAVFTYIKELKDLGIKKEAIKDNLSEIYSEYDAFDVLGNYEEYMQELSDIKAAKKENCKNIRTAERIIFREENRNKNMSKERQSDGENKQYNEQHKKKD